MKEEKTALRELIRGEAIMMGEEERRQSDEALFQNLRTLPEFQKARSLFLFAGIGTEPDTLSLAASLLAEGRNVAMPLTLPERAMEARLITGSGDLKAGYCGIPEPLEKTAVLSRQEIDFVLVPALCYDRSGYRLGQGGGYYDRWLEGFSGFTAGLCRGRFLQEKLPREAFDRPVAAVVTEREILRPGT